MDVHVSKHNRHHHHHHHHHHSHLHHHQRQHHHHPNQHDNQQNNNTVDDGYSPFNTTTCIKNSDCIASRLPSPYDDEHGAVPVHHQDGCTPFSVLEPPSVFQPVGLDPTSCLIQPYSRVLHSPCLQLDGLRYESPGSRLDPHSPMCMVPLPEHFGEPSFIRKRNERERERVRCVNDGYDRLKEHLPLADKDRRLSKVETLRGAIKYIRQLKRLLEDSDEEQDSGSEISRGNGGTNRIKRYNNSNLSTGRKYRSWSLSSSDPESSLSDS